ncbi:MAG: hypothetical protein PHS97_06840 [Oscillospiraceae bacterium]|nr:hypothetical protein [Oscillospiraceae bacterium]
MEQSYSVPLQKLVQQFHMKPIYQAPDYEKIQITVVDVNRPALQLAGFFEHFEPMRLQVIGLVETTYLEELTHEQRLVAFDRYFCSKFQRSLLPEADSRWRNA